MEILIIISYNNKHPFSVKDRIEHGKATYKGNHRKENEQCGTYLIGVSYEFTIFYEVFRIFYY